MDLRNGSDLLRIHQFLESVAAAPVVLSRRSKGNPQETWYFSWVEDSERPGVQARIVAEVSRGGDIQFVVVRTVGEGPTIRSSATAFPYSLAAGSSIAYARSMVDAAKARALGITLATVGFAVETQY